MFQILNTGARVVESDPGSAPLMFQIVNTGARVVESDSGSARGKCFRSSTQVRASSNLIPEVRDANVSDP